MKRKELSVAKQVLLQKTVHGLLLIVAGVLQLFDNAVCTALAGVIFIVSSACLIGLLVAKKEFSDEMSERNLAEAQASTLLKLQLIFCFAAMALLLAANFPFGWDVNWRRVLVSALFFAVGISDCMTGLTFRKLEAE